MCALLINAAKFGYIDKMQEILALNQYDIDRRDMFGNTALGHASNSGNVECAKLLIDAGATVHTMNVNECTPLDCASLQGHVECVRLLLVYYENHESMYFVEHTTFMNAVKWDHGNCVKVFLEYNFDPDLPNSVGSTALHECCQESNINVLKLLLEYGVNIDLQNTCGSTALHLASFFDQTDSVELLLEYGADVNKQDIKGRTALDRGCKQALENWKSYLPEWDRFIMAKRYPTEFNQIALTWILCCKRKKLCSKDICYLIIKYIARAWKSQPE